MARQRTPEGPPPPPPVQKLRLRYAKRGAMRFTSTRDFQRALQRALRRGSVPVAYSAGFHPHPRISYANAAPTGAASEAEYVEISLTRRCDPEDVRALVDAALPTGIDIVEAVEASPGALAERLQASRWELVLPGVPADVAAAAVRRFLDLDEALVTRMTKSGERTFDVRAAVVELILEHHANGVDDADCAILRMVVRHVTPTVRPDDVLTALRTAAALAYDASPRVTRLAQGPLLPGAQVADPLAADRDATGG